MKKIIISSVFLALISAGCEDDDKPIANSGEVTITSDLTLEGNTYTFNGFSFKQGKVIYYNPESGDVAPDLIVTPDNSGVEITAILQFFNNPAQKQLFGYLDEFNDLNSATEFFDNYTEVSESLGFSVWANPIKQNQVWIVKTLDDHYAKILIKDVSTFLKDTRPYAETTFKWVYQPDGSVFFN